MFIFTKFLLLSFAVAIWASDTCDDTCCSNNWLGYRGSCYRYITFPKTWQDARNYCLTLGADLVSIHSAEENNIINGLIGGAQVWIGFNDLEIEGQCFWSDGTASFYTNWNQNQPDDTGSTEDCGYMNSGPSSGLWNDSTCGHVVAFVCKK